MLVPRGLATNRCRMPRTMRPGSCNSRTLWTRWRSTTKVAALSRSILRLRSNDRMRTLEEHAKALADGRTTSRVLVEQCLARIADPNGEGARVFIKVHADQAR